MPMLLFVYDEANRAARLLAVHVDGKAFRDRDARREQIAQTLPD
ncbi:hypothetical protein [Sphingopyxis sp. JAI128]|nr:hypothetical protein [Sphingopyxis sp. JAI128]MBB6424963.1 hypothetical protein [Sphingopyxis sp. JAI128]